MSEALSVILSKMQEFDDAISSDIDPEKLIGDLRGKVDAINHVINEMESRAGYWKAQADRITTQRVAIENNIKRLKQYVLFQMQQSGFDSLPGNDWRIKRQRNKPTVETTREPTAHDVLLGGKNDLIRVIPTTYQWDKNALAEAIKSGKKFDFANLKESECIRFYPNNGRKNIDGNRNTDNVAGKIGSRDESPCSIGAQES